MMIYCNFHNDSMPAKLEIKGMGSDIRDELSAILTELMKTDSGKHLVIDAYKQSFDPEWEEIFDKEIREFPDQNRSKK